MQIVEISNLIKEMKAPDYIPVDLDFVPEKPKDNSSNEEKLAELEKRIVDARAASKAATLAADKEGSKKARETVKKLKKEKKALEKLIAEDQNSKVDNSSQIAELEKQLADAQLRAQDAEENDDDEAEEAAYAEIDKLMDEINALKTLQVDQSKS